jgi:4-coumarate--CoA ligase
MFHAAVAPYTHVSTLRAAYPAFIMRRFELEMYLASVEKYGVTNLMMVPPMLLAVVNLAASSAAQAARVRRQLRSVRAVVGGGAPIDKELQARMQAILLKETPMTQIWAMSETCCIASYFYHPEPDTTGSVGRFLPNLDIKLVDDNGAEVETGHRGELCIRGPTVIRGYLNNAEANARGWDIEGYMHTGDILLQNPTTGLWYVVDRKKELIKVRGFQVAPAEVEGVLLAHPAIKDVAVIGVPGGSSGELPRAFVVTVEERQLEAEEVKTWVKEKLAVYKWLEGGVEFIDAVPRNASGKMLKRVLRERLAVEVKGKL